VLIVVDLVVTHDPPQMALIPAEGAVQQLAAASADPASGRLAFMRGVRTLQSTVRIPASARIAPDAAVKFEPRSRIMNLIPICLVAKVHDQITCLLAVHAPVGCRVTPRMRIHLVTCSMTARI